MPGPPAETVQKSSVPENHVDAAFYLIRENRPEEAEERLKKLDPAVRELLSCCLGLAARLGGKEARPPCADDCAALLDELERLQQALRARAPLSLEKMCYCRALERFGVYEPLPAGHAFGTGWDGRPGDLVQVYAELRNFATAKNGPFHETALACTLTLRDGDNKPVWRQDRPAQVERSRSSRQDCYLSCHFYVPPRLPPGDYKLHLTVKDVTGLSGEEPPAHRTASRTLDFRVRAPGMAQAAGN
jgi:hypothetical protein